MGYGLKKCIFYAVITALLVALSTLWYVSKKSSEEYKRQEEMYRISCELDESSKRLNYLYGYEKFETDSAAKELKELNGIVKEPGLCLFISIALWLYSSIATYKEYLYESLEKKRFYVKAALEYELHFCNKTMKQISGIANTIQESKNIVRLLALCDNKAGRALTECYKTHQEANQADLFIKIKKRIPSLELLYFPDTIIGLPDYYYGLQQRARYTVDELKKCAHMTDEELDDQYHQHASIIKHLRRTNRIKYKIK